MMGWTKKQARESRRRLAREPRLFWGDEPVEQFSYISWALRVEQ